MCEATGKGSAGRNKSSIMVFALSALLVLGIAPCAGGCSAPETLISGGYVPSEIAGIESGGEFDTSSITPREDGGLSLENIEGFWIYEDLVNEDSAGSSDDDNVPAVTDKAIVLNEEKIECLPRSIDLRPFSPMKGLISQGFGYGSAAFAHAKSEKKDAGSMSRQEVLDMLASGIIDVMWTLPYGGNGFVSTISGNTLALGFLDADTRINEYGSIADKEGNAISDCSLTEVDYEINLDGDRLTLTYGEVSASYVQDPTSPLSTIHITKWLSEPLYEEGGSLGMLGRSLQDLVDKGFSCKCDMDEFLPTCGLSEEFDLETPSGTTLTAKVVNPYEKSVPFGYAKLCWYRYSGGKSGTLTVGMPAPSEGGHASQVFGVTPYADIYNRYEMPYESAQNYLCYKSGYTGSISPIVAFGDGFSTGETILNSERSCEIRVEFDDNVLSSITVGDPVYLNAGLQDNIAHDDLDGLKPSVYREVTEKRDEILTELKKAFKRAGLKANINGKTGEVVMDNSVLFSTNSYQLGDSGKAYLNEVFAAYAEVILDDKYSAFLKEISFEGNTDSDGSSEHNKKLSEHRGNAVMDYCASLLDGTQKAAFDELAVCRGYGESDLVYDKNGNEDKSASRRVAIKFMLKVDGLSSEAGSQAVGEQQNATAANASDPATSGSAPDSNTEQSDKDELSKFRSIAGKFDQAWALSEEDESDGSKHVVLLLLSDVHDYCGYFNVKADKTSNASVAYTFGETSIADQNQNPQKITVHHSSGDDTLTIVFNAWQQDNAVSLTDFTGEVCDLEPADDMDAVISFIEDILAQ